MQLELTCRLKVTDDRETVSFTADIRELIEFAENNPGKKLVFIAVLPELDGGLAPVYVKADNPRRK